MMNMIVLGVGTVLTAAYLFFLFRGAEYDGMIEPLDTDEFPFKTETIFGNARKAYYYLYTGALRIS